MTCKVPKGKAQFYGNIFRKFNIPKRFRIITDNDLVISELLNLYAEYTQRESSSIQEICNSESLPVNESESTQPSSDSQSNSLLIAHETQSEVWSFKTEMRRRIPSRLMKPTLFNAIANSANCYIIFGNERGVLTVKGDDSQNIETTTKKLDNVAEAFSIFCASPRVFDFHSWETESSGVSLSVIDLAHEDARDQMLTTIIDPNSAQAPKLADLGIMVMAKNGAIVRPVRSGHLQKTVVSSPRTDFWHDLPVLAHGKQPSIPLLRSHILIRTVPARQPQDVPVQPHAVPTTIEEWVERTLRSTPLPLNTVPPLDEVTVDGNRSGPTQERRARVRRAPEPKRDLSAASPEHNLPAASPEHNLPAASPKWDLPVASPEHNLPAASPKWDLPAALSRLDLPAASQKHDQPAASPKLIDVEEDPTAEPINDRPAVLPKHSLPAALAELIDIEKEIIPEPRNDRPAVLPKHDQPAASPNLIDMDDDVVPEPAPTSTSGSVVSSYKTASQFGTRGLSQDLLTGEQEPIWINSASPLAPGMSATLAPNVTANILSHPRTNTDFQTASTLSIAHKRFTTPKSPASQLLGQNQDPSWVNRNPVAKAKEITAPSPIEVRNAGNSRPSIAKQTSYSAAAKRGNAGPGLRGSPNGALQGSSPQFQEQLQVKSEVQSRQFHRTMNQKAANSGSFDLVEASRSATMQILQSVRAFKGTLKLEVDIGRILIKTGTLPATITTGTRFDLRDWSSIFNPSSKSTRASTFFTTALPASDMDMSFLMHLKSSAGRKLFPASPSSCKTTYQFLCGTNTGDEEVVVHVANGGTGSVQVLSTEHLVGAVQWHFPRRQWDARLAVTATEKIGDYQKAVVSITDTLSVTPSPNKKSLVLAAELGDSGLFFRSARMRREANFTMDDDIVISCVEVQNLGPAQERTRYQSLKRGREAVRKDGDLWWEMKVWSRKTNALLQQSEDLTLGERANWSAEDIIKGERLQHLHSLATDIVAQIDGMGLAIRETATVPTSTISVAARSEMPSRASQASSFW
ncbi:MAG: hypothetical protein LQ350_003843 [Teloschistes chrysophthalmus]|nr:MAG: hypothetical protein LQ350_003843 [Niorma chrysophthalma]